MHGLCDCQLALAVFTFFHNICSIFVLLGPIKELTLETECASFLSQSPFMNQPES